MTRCNLRTLRRPLAWAVALSTGLSACGGGSVGVGLGLGFGDDPYFVDPDADLVHFVVSRFDAIAGVERLLATVPGGIEQVVGAPGALRSQACAGGGTLTSWKVDASTFRLTAANCFPQTDRNDRLVYDGVWTFRLGGSTGGTTGAATGTPTGAPTGAATGTTTGYTAAGTCPAGQACSLTGTADTSQVRFGYGVANQRVIGRTLQVSTSAAGVRTATVSASNESLVLNDGIAATANGTLEQLDFYAGGVTYRVSGTRQRDTLRLASPFNGTITLGAEVAAALDRNNDGVTDRELTIPWWRFGS